MTLGIFAGVVGYAHGGRTIASVAAVDVDPAAMVVTGDFAVQNGNTVSATFDATAAVANEEFYKVCWQVDYADGQHEVWLLRLLILGGCGT